MPREKAQAAPTARQSIDAPCRGGLLCSSAEAGVMPVERREQAIVIWIGSTGNGGNPMFKWKAVAFGRWHEPDDARVSSPDLRGARGEIPRAYSATTGRVLSCEMGRIARR